MIAFGRVSQRRWRFGMVAVYLLLILSPFLSSVRTPLATSGAHADENIDKLCLPPYKNEGDFQSPKGGWVSVQIIDRAHMKLTINDVGGNCVSPANLALSQLAPTVPWSQVFTDNFILTDPDTTDSFTYRHCVGDKCSDDTQIVRFNDSVIRNDAADINDSYYDDQVNATSFKNFISSSELLIGIEEDALSGSGITCSGTNSNFELGNLQSDGKGLKWFCNGGDITQAGDGPGLMHAVHGLYMKDAIDPATYTNWDITFNYVNGQVQSVADNFSAKRSFSWCTGLTPAQFRSDSCNGDEELFGADGKPLTKADMDAVGGGNIPVVIKADGKSGTTTIHVAGSTSVSAVGAVAVATNNQSNKKDAPSCAVTNALSFIVCPFIQVADDFYTKQVEPIVLDLLKNGTLDPSSKNIANAKLVHDQFKNLTNVLFVIIFLVIIFSTTLSIGIDNYNVKKMLPRLVAAVILVQFSWILMQLAFDISNLLAAGISALPIFNIPISGGHIPASSYIVAGGISLLFGSIGLAAGLLIPFLLVLLALIIGILGVFLTLIIRQYIIIVLVVLAPLAFVAWVLPNTENIFKTWSKMLIRLLLMYPLIVLIFSMAGLFSKIQPASTNGLTGITAAIVPIIAFYMVPWTFKWAGGAMAAVGGFVTARASGLSRKTSEPMRKRWNETNPIYGSQKGVNDAAARQLKAANLYNKNTPASRLRARMITGNYGKVGSKRLADSAHKAQVEQVGAEKQAMALSMESLSFSDQQTKLQEIAMTSKNVYARQAAMETMLDKGMVGKDGLAGVAMANPAGFDADPAFTRLKSEKFEDISNKVGFLLSDGNTIQEKVQDFSTKASYEQLSKTKSSALEIIREQAAAPGFDSGAKAELSRKAGVVLDNPRLMQSVKGGEEKELLGLAGRNTETTAGTDQFPPGTNLPPGV